MNKKWAVKRITINLTKNEADILSFYCNLTGRPATDVIRELIRCLPTDTEQLTLQNSIGLEDLVEQEWSKSKSA